MKIIIICFIISPFLFQSCGRKCSNDVPIIEIDSKIIEYFGMYKQGNWWVYENSKKTKKDSVFITEFYESYTCDTKDYKSAPIFRRVKINSTFLNTNVGTLLDLFLERNESSWGVKVSPITMKFENSISFSNLVPPKILDTLFLSNTIHYTNVLKVNTSTAIFVAPLIGIVKFENERDTFNLTKYKIN